MRELTFEALSPYHRIDEDLAMANIRVNMERGCQEFSPALCVNDGTFVIAGSGPSLPSFLEEIKGERLKGRPVCAINGAHDFLVGNGFKPDLFVTCDPKTTILGNIKHANERTIYLLASRAHPEVFDALKGKQVVIWHAAACAGPPHDPTSNKWEDLNLTPECELWKGRRGMGGGTTSGLRAIYIAAEMGFRKFVLYGMDSCLAADKRTKRFSGENIGPNKPLDVIVGGRRFWANAAMAMQANEFQKVLGSLPITVEAKGDGLIAAILAERKKRGLRT